MPALRIKYPKLGVITHVLRSERVTLGRAADNSIQIPHESISNHHAEIVAANGGYRLRDLQSTNHCCVDGEQITEIELKAGSRIVFGSIECEFDPHATTNARPPELALPPPPSAEPSYLENENRDLRAHVASLQRRFDILGSARLTAGKVDHTPFATTNDAMRGLTTERDDLRQQAAGLRLEVNRVREELAMTARERDAARQAAAGLQTERTTLQLELQQAELRIERLRSELIIASESAPAPAPPPPPTRPPLVAPVRPAAVAPRPPARVASAVAPAPPIIPAPAPSSGGPTRLPAAVAALRNRVTQLAAAPTDRTLLIEAHAESERLLASSAHLGAHATRRISIRVKALLANLVTEASSPAAGTLRTLRQSTELLERLLDPSLHQAAVELPTGRVLAMDDDAELLAIITSLLRSSGLEVTSCQTAEEAMIAIDAVRFDTIIADIGLPGIQGTDFCAHARAQPAYRHTPILFLTGADTVEKRAATSLNGGTEFIAKPFATDELALKVEVWTLKHQLRLV